MNDLELLFSTGKIGEEDDPQEVINLLKYSAVDDVQSLFAILVKYHTSPMVIPALAAVLGSTPTEYFTPQIKKDLFQILITYEADDLALLLELIKSRVFGRGLGSRTQKLFRRVLESWTETDYKTQIVAFHSEVKSLVLLCHPRLQGVRGELVQSLFSRNKLI